MAGTFEEAKHPRNHGKFASGSGGSSGGAANGRSPRAAAKAIAKIGKAKQYQLDKAKVDAMLARTQPPAAPTSGPRPEARKAAPKSAGGGPTPKSPAPRVAKPAAKPPTTASTQSPAVGVTSGAEKGSTLPTSSAFSPENALKLGSRMSQLRPQFNEFMAMKSAVRNISSPEERAAQELYVGKGYRPINAQLRGTGLGEGYEHTAMPKADVDAAIGHLDAVLSRSRTTAPVLTYRGAGEAPHWDAMKPGDTFVDKGYGSTSVDPSMVRTYDGGPILAITSPKGTKIAAIDSNMVGEYEMLLARGTKFRLDKKSEHDGRPVLHLSVVSQDHN